MTREKRLNSDLTEGPLLSKIILFSLPLIVSNDVSQNNVGRNLLQFGRFFSDKRCFSSEMSKCTCNVIKKPSSNPNAFSMRRESGIFIDLRPRIMALSVCGCSPIDSAKCPLLSLRLFNSRCKNKPGCNPLSISIVAFILQK